NGAAPTIANVYDCTDRGQRRAPTLRPLDRANAADLEAARARFGHGAHVAGIIAGQHTARTKDGEERQMSGMAPSANLVIYKVLDNNGSGGGSRLDKGHRHILASQQDRGT